MKISTLPPNSKDVQLVFAFKKGKRNYAEVIAIILVSRALYMKTIRSEKIRVIEDEGADEVEDKRLYQALTKEMANMTITLEEELPF